MADGTGASDGIRTQTRIGQRFRDGKGVEYAYELTEFDGCIVLDVANRDTRLSVMMSREVADSLAERIGFMLQDMARRA